jgi:hypothetical protein
MDVRSAAIRLSSPDEEDLPAGRGSGIKERQIIDYLLSPLLRYGRESLRESGEIGDSLTSGLSGYRPDSVIAGSIVEERCLPAAQNICSPAAQNI